jgi:hypothetical protein
MITKQEACAIATSKVPAKEQEAIQESHASFQGVLNAIKAESNRGNYWCNIYPYELNENQRQNLKNMGFRIDMFDQISWYPEEYYKKQRNKNILGMTLTALFIIVFFGAIIIYGR